MFIIEGPSEITKLPFCNKWIFHWWKYGKTSPYMRIGDYCKITHSQVGVIEKKDCHSSIEVISVRHRCDGTSMFTLTGSREFNIQQPCLLASIPMSQAKPIPSRWWHMTHEGIVAHMPAWAHPVALVCNYLDSCVCFSLCININLWSFRQAWPFSTHLWGYHLWELENLVMTYDVPHAKAMRKWS